MPRRSTVRPASRDQAFSAVCRLTCSKTASERVTTDRSSASAPEEVGHQRSDLVALLTAAASECTHSKNDRNEAANSRASESDAPVTPQAYAKLPTPFGSQTATLLSTTPPDVVPNSP